MSARLSESWARELLSRMALRRRPSAIRALMPYLARPNMISLAGGFPNLRTFPFVGVDVHLSSHQPTITMSTSDMASALQYGPSFGLPGLLSQLAEIQRIEHPGVNSKGALGKDWSICVGTGSQDLIDKMLFAVLNEHDCVLIESPAYAGILSSLNGVGARSVDVPTDRDGLIPSELNRILSSWPASSLQKRPRVLYTVPSGQNPSGSSLSLERRGELLDVARKFDLLVLEDDPYYYLQYRPKRLPSLWSMDTEGRVVRFDSFSKVLSAGLRVGWMSGYHTLVEQVQLSVQAGELQASSFTQAIVERTLRQWGQAGWNAHLATVQAFYCERRDVFLRALGKHLTGLATWEIPVAGMFVWIKLEGIDDSSEFMLKAAEADVLVVPGVAFLPNGGRSQHVRATFAVASDEQMDTAIARLADLLRQLKK